MREPTLDYVDHAAIYSAALIFLFRVVWAICPWILAALSEKASQRLIIYCGGLCFLRKHQTCLGIATHLGGASHDALHRLLGKGMEIATLLMTTCLSLATHLATGGPCWLILDDVILPKEYSKKMVAAYFDYDYVHDRPIRCLRVVVLCWTNGLIKIPVAFALWHKKGCAYLQETGRKFRTKNQLARLLVWKVVRKGLPFDYLVFDCWYASAKNLRFFHRLGLPFVGAVRFNRKLRLPSFPLSEAPPRKRRRHPIWKTKRACELAGEYPHSRDWPYYEATRCRARRWLIYLEGVPFPLTLVCIKNYARLPAFKEMVTPSEKKQKDPNKYLVTNDVRLTTVQIIARYRSRWAIEVLFRDCKQHLGLGAYQGQTVEAHVGHIACVFFSYVLMEHLKPLATSASRVAHTLTLGEVKAWLRRQVVRVEHKGDQTVMVCQPLALPTEEEVEMMMQACLEEASGNRMSPETPFLHHHISQPSKFYELKKCA